MQVSLGSDLARCSYCVHAAIVQYVSERTALIPSAGPVYWVSQGRSEPEDYGIGVVLGGCYGASVEMQGIWNRQLLGRLMIECDFASCSHASVVTGRPG